MPDDILTQNRLQDLAPSLEERDKKILSYVQLCRFITTGQIHRLLFTGAASKIAGLKATNRKLNRLQSLGLIKALERPIGGIRAGSASRIWYLTDGGDHILHLLSGEIYERKRFFVPSTYFLSHTVAVTECFVQLTEICAKEGLALARTEMEPECWRSYKLKGRSDTLRPDMYAVTRCGDYEDRWFIEVDLRTETPNRITEKCRRYYEFYYDGLKKDPQEVFPLVVWIVMDAARKGTLIAYIRNEFKNQPKIFTVITPDELEPLLRQGVWGSVLC